MPKKTDHSPKTKLADLFRQLSFFQPERDENKQWTGKFLVNQKKVNEEHAKHADSNILSDLVCPPDLDTLLHLIGEASLELREFMGEHDQTKEQVMSFMADAKLIYEQLSQCISGLPEGMPVLEMITLMVGRYRQMYDMLHQVAHDLPVEEVKGRVFRFLEWKGSSLKPLVNQNDEKTTEADASGREPVCTCNQNKFPCPVHGNYCVHDLVCTCEKVIQHVNLSCPIHRPNDSRQPISPDTQS